MPAADLESQLQGDGRLATGTAAQEICKRGEKADGTEEFQRNVPLRPVRYGLLGYLHRGLAEHSGKRHQPAGTLGADRA